MGQADVPEMNVFDGALAQVVLLLDDADEVSAVASSAKANGELPAFMDTAAAVILVRCACGVRSSLRVGVSSPARVLSKDTPGQV